MTGGTRLVSTQGINEDLTVYGRWSENAYAIPTKIGVEISADNRAINLISFSTTYSRRIITLTADVNNIFIYGSTSVKLVIIAKRERRCKR